MTIDQIQSQLGSVADDIATYAHERIQRESYELADRLDAELTTDRVVEFLQENSSDLADIAEAFAGTIADHLARRDPETLREALADAEELHTFDRDDVERYLRELDDYATSVRDLSRERLEDVPSELDSIASEIGHLVRALTSVLDA